MKPNNLPPLRGRKPIHPWGKTKVGKWFFSPKNLYACVTNRNKNTSEKWVCYQKNGMFQAVRKA